MEIALELTVALHNLKSDVIGIVKNHDRFELLIKENENTLDTVNITEFGAVHFNYQLPKSYCHWILFPDNNNMNEMLDNPYEWDKFMRQF